MNNLGQWEACPDDYFFSMSGSVWGWATWKRVVDQWDPEYKFMNDKYAISNLYSEFGKEESDSFMRTCIRHLESGREHYESILGSYGWLNFVRDYLGLLSEDI